LTGLEFSCESPTLDLVGYNSMHSFVVFIYKNCLTRLNWTLCIVDLG